MTETPEKPDITDTTQKPIASPATAMSSSSSSSSSTTSTSTATPTAETEPDLGKVITTLIALSPLALQTTTVTGHPDQGVFILNPWPDLNLWGKKIQPTLGGTVMETRLQMPAAALKPWSQLGTMERQLIFPSGPPDPDKIRLQYLEWGIATARGTSFYGVCDDMACVTISLLVAAGGRIPNGTRVELYGLGGKLGHAFVVVNRAPSSIPRDPSSWGDECVIVDQWYALQTGTPPVSYTSGPGRNTGYLAWLVKNGGLSMAPVSEFRTGAYSSIKMPLKYR